MRPSAPAYVPQGYHRSLKGFYELKDLFLW